MRLDEQSLEPSAGHRNGRAAETVKNPAGAMSGEYQMDAQTDREALHDPRVELGIAQRVLVPAEVYPYRAGVVGGMVAGTVMALVMAAWGALSGNSIWFPVNLIAATVLPDLQAAPAQMLEQFHPAGAVVGTLIHLAMSIGLGLVFATLLPTLPGTPFLWALIVGPLLWFTAEYLALPLVNPRMEALINAPSFSIAHMSYSLVLGWFVSRTPKVPVS